MFWMNPDNGCKDRNSSKGEKEVPMNTIFSYMNLQDNKQSIAFRIQHSNMESFNNFSIAPGNLISNHLTFSITKRKHDVV